VATKVIFVGRVPTRSFANCMSERQRSAHSTVSLQPAKAILHIDSGAACDRQNDSGKAGTKVMRRAKFNSREFKIFPPCFV
jgi:hypothetical protein